jgi:hypothetical protein
MAQGTGVPGLREIALRGDGARELHFFLLHTERVLLPYWRGEKPKFISRNTEIYFVKKKRRTNREYITNTTRIKSERKTAATGE